MRGFVGGDAAAGTAVADAPTRDNLKLVVGIGPFIEGLLNEAGIFTFDDLAGASVERLQDILPDVHDSRVEREDWLGQAAEFVRAKAEGRDLDELARDDQIT
jgi:predicted flap endonuclease-1-like 5' DNA nuclease